MTRNQSVPARLVVLFLAATALFAVPVAAQIAPLGDPGNAVRSRADLEELLAFYQDAIASPAYSGEAKEQMSIEANAIEVRLRDGDFRMGDRIVLDVHGEPSLPDTVRVQAGPMISLPNFGDVDLKGVLRAEVEDRITEALRNFLRNPIVEAEALMRLSVQGAVVAPGFYTVPARILLSEALMVAGGLAPTAKTEETRLERGATVIMDGEEVQEALRAGLSLDQLNLQAGDQVVVPAQGGSLLTNIGVIVGVVGSLGILLLQLSGGGG